MSETTLAASNAANNYTLKNNEDGSFAIKKAAVDVLTIAANGEATLNLAPATVAQADLAPNVVGNGPAFSAHTATATNVSANVVIKIIYAVEDFDTANCFADSIFTPNVAGYYQINAACYTGAPAQANAAYSINIEKNNVIYATNLYMDSSAGMYISQDISALVYLNGTTDSVRVTLVQGGTVTINTSPSNAYHFSGYLARAA